MIPISKEVLEEELNLAIRVVTKWKNKLAQGIPGQDLPGNEDALDEFTRELVAEFLLISGKFETMANVISADGG